MAFKSFKKLFLSIADDVPEDLPGVIKTLKELVRAINILQTNVSSTLDPMTSLIQNDSIVLSGIQLQSGQVNIINHTLGRKLTGWVIIRNRSSELVWDGQDANPSPNLTLWLFTNNNVTVDLLVF